LSILKEKTQGGKFLIIVPSSTLDNWAREIELWCNNLTYEIYAGSLSDRRNLQYDIEQGEDIDIVLTNYNIATGSSEDRRFLRSLRCSVLILDEGHMVKNSNSQRSKHLQGFKIPFKLLITGTPIQNNLLELLALLTFINPQLFASFSRDMKSIFADSVETSTQLEHGVSKMRIESAAKILAPFVLRRKKDEVRKDIPLKTVKIKYCQPSAEQKELIHELMMSSKKFVADSVEVRGKKVFTTQLNNVLMQLRKVANHELLIRRIYSDEVIPKVAKALKKELEYLDTKMDHLIEDLSYMSDFEINLICEDKKVWLFSSSMESNLL
jgi:SNF2 family DNA or RNA helicase